MTEAQKCSVGSMKVTQVQKLALRSLQLWLWVIAVWRNSDFLTFIFTFHPSLILGDRLSTKVVWNRKLLPKFVTLLYHDKVLKYTYASLQDYTTSSWSISKFTTLYHAKVFRQSTPFIISFKITVTKVLKYI